MSDSQGGAGRREVAFRLFAAEYDDADRSYSESDEERAPNYVVTPSGARVNRLFVVGVLTEVEAVSEDYLRARVVDPTGPFVVYAGQYQPEAMNFLERAEPPLFVAVTGKARTFQPEDSDRVYTSIRPESINEVDAATRDRWVLQAAEQTIDRVQHAAAAKLTAADGDRLEAALLAHDVEESLAAGIPLALEHYGTTGEYLASLRELAIDAARVVAGERDEVAGLSLRPGDGNDEPLPALAERTIDVPAAEPTETADAFEDVPEPDDEQSPSDEEIDDAVAAADLDTPERDATAGDEGSDGSMGTGDAVGDGASDTTASDSPSDATASDALSDTTASNVSSDSDDGNAADDSAESAGAGEEELEEFDGEFELDEEERAEIEAEYGTEFQSGSEVEQPGEADIETPTEPPAEPATSDTVEEGATEAGSDVSEPGSGEEGGAGGQDGEDELGDFGTADAGEEEISGGDVSDDDRDEAAVDDGLEADDDVDETTEDAAAAYDGEAAEDEAEDVETAGDVALDDAVMDAMVDLDDGDGADRDAVIAEVVQATGVDPGEVEEAIQEALMDGRCYEPNDETLKAI